MEKYILTGMISFILGFLVTTIFYEQDIQHTCKKGGVFSLTLSENKILCRTFVK